MRTIELELAAELTDRVAAEIIGQNEPGDPNPHSPRPEDWTRGLIHFANPNTVESARWRIREGFGPVEGSVWVTVYETTRHYGGPEEGGWWYILDVPIHTVAVYPNAEDPEVIREELRERFQSYSVLGGVAIWVAIEDEPGLLEFTERPFYQ